MDKLFYAVPLMGLFGLLYTFIKSNWVSKQDAGTDRMQEISKHIAEGAMAFFVGAVFSATAGYIGMRVATKANVRTAHAARSSLSKALSVSFTGGSVMGLGVAGLAVLGLGSLFILLKTVFAAGYVDSAEMLRTIEVLTGFSLGAESIALFARVGGGIYTKAADVGADL